MSYCTLISSNQDRLSSHCFANHIPTRCTKTLQLHTQDNTLLSQSEHLFPRICVAMVTEICNRGAAPAMFPAESLASSVITIHRYYLAAISNIPLQQSTFFREMTFSCYFHILSNSRNVKFKSNKESNIL